MKTELQIAADKLVREIFGVQPGETVVLTADYESCEAVLRAVEASVREAWATVMTVTVPTPNRRCHRLRRVSMSRTRYRSTSSSLMFRKPSDTNSRPSDS